METATSCATCVSPKFNSDLPTLLWPNAARLPWQQLIMEFFSCPVRSSWKYLRDLLCILRHVSLRLAKKKQSIKQTNKKNEGHLEAMETCLHAWVCLTCPEICSTGAGWRQWWVAHPAKCAPGRTSRRRSSSDGLARWPQTASLKLIPAGQQTPATRWSNWS